VVCSENFHGTKLLSVLTALLTFNVVSRFPFTVPVQFISTLCCNIFTSISPVTEKWADSRRMAALEHSSKRRRNAPEEVTIVKSFTKSAADCQNNFIVDRDHNFVDLDRVVADCAAIVYEQCPLLTNSATRRKPPLALIRFARGGKTTTLAALFDKLKSDNKVHPILISFNGGGSAAFTRRRGETQYQALLRLIAAQLNDYTPEHTPNFVVDREALDDHLGDNVVLLIDELNKLQAPLDSDAGNLLRTMFLDQAGRYLVFTSHFPVALNPDTVTALDILGSHQNGRMSDRAVKTVTMSSASSATYVSDLRGMSTACEALTDEYAAWLGHIPSLIYCTMSDTGKYGVVTPTERFMQMDVVIPADKEIDILKRFLDELFTGRRDAEVSVYYGGLASMGPNSTISYPLCYVKGILGQLNLLEGITVILTILNKLESYLNSKFSGLAWDCTVQVAIILQMLPVHMHGIRGPFGVVPFGVKPALAFRTLPSECSTLEDARDRMDKIFSEYQSHTLVYVGSANARFPEVEGFVAYTDGGSTPAHIVGFQMKTADVKPRKSMDTKIINGGGVLIRGRSLAKRPRSAKDGWNYMTSAEVRELLGVSLLLAMPRKWLKDA
jgi:hypothetical protein